MRADDEGSDLRNTNAPFPGIMTVELQPRVLHRMVRNSKSVDGGPQPPASPFSDVRLRGPRNHQSDKIAGYRQRDCEAPSVRVVAQPRKAVHDRQPDERTHTRQGVGACAIEAQGHDDGGCVGGQGAPRREDEAAGDEMGPATPVGDGLPDFGGRDADVLRGIGSVWRVGGNALLEELAVTGADA